MNDGLNSFSRYNGRNKAVAWVVFDGTTGTIQSSYNIRSVQRDSAGQYSIELAVALPDTNYCVFGTAKTDGTNNPFVCLRTGTGTPTTKQIRVIGVTTAPAAALFDSSEVHVVFFGDALTS